MLNFQPITIADKEKISAFIRPYQYKACELGFVNLFVWRKQYEFRYCIEDGFLFMRSTADDGKYYYKLPYGEGDLTAALRKLVEHTRCEGHELNIYALTEEMRALAENALPGAFVYSDNRAAADYIYLSESLATLSGKKLHSKRNFINRFYQEYGDRISVSPIDPDHLDELRAFHHKWCESMQSDDSLEKETCAVLQAFDHYRALELQGLVLRVGGNIVAFSYGSKLTEDTFDVHVEKADTDYTGAYTVINNLMAQEFSGRFKYFNREEDVGVEGLRKAKLSYQPEIILMRFDARFAGEAK